MEHPIAARFVRSFTWLLLTLAGCAGPTGSEIAAVCGSRVTGLEDVLLLGGTGEAFRTSGDPTSLGDITESLHVYLPEGTGDGAEVVVTHDVSWPHDGLAVTRTTLSGGLANFTLGGTNGGQAFSIEGTLDVLSGGASIVVHRNFAPPHSDVADQGEAELTLCHSAGSPPPQILGWIPATITPLSPIRFAPSTALAEGFTLHVMAGDEEIPSITTVSGHVEVTPLDAWPPGVALSVWTDHLDVLGREVEIILSDVEVLTTSAVITDPSLDTAPPAGSVDGHEAVWMSDGAVRFGTLGGGTSSGGGAGMIALDAGDATVAHVTVDCTGAWWQRRIALVGENGELGEPETLECGGGAVIDVPVPASGRVYLVVDNDPGTPRPQWLSPRTFAVVVDDIVFE